MIFAHFITAPQIEHQIHLRQKLHPDIIITTGERIPPATQVLISGRPGRDALLAAPELKYVLIPFAGLNAETATLMRDFPQVSVHNLHHNALITGEMALALLLAAARQLIPIDREFRKHDWTLRYNTVPTVILDGKTVVIVGYGEIGRYLGKVLTAMGMHVLGVRRTVQPDDDPERIFPIDSLHEILPRADVLMVCVPATPATDNLIGETELRLMPRGGLLVNVGRGAVIDQTALYNALKDGHLYAAGSDVWYHYPTDIESRTHTPPADVPFHELDNMVMSPHRGGAGGTDEVEYRRMDAIAQSLNALIENGTMPHRVQVERGY